MVVVWICEECQDKIPGNVYPCMLIALGSPNEMATAKVCPFLIPCETRWRKHTLTKLEFHAPIIKTKKEGIGDEG